jgi:hypothetical protein
MFVDELAIWHKKNSYCYCQVKLETGNSEDLTTAIVSSVRRPLTAALRVGLLSFRFKNTSDLFALTPMLH